MVLSAATQVLLYMSAQNELSDKAEENISAIKQCVDLNDICTYIMIDKVTEPLAAGRSDANTFQYLLAPGASQSDFVPKGFRVEDKDVSSPLVFDTILGNAHRHFQESLAPDLPRQKLLIFWGHGGGMVMLDEQQQAGVARAQANMKAFADVLVRRTERKTPLNFDIIAFDSCYMCMIETMHQLRAVSQYALCSSTMVDADGFPYEEIFKALKTNGQTYTPQTAAASISDIYNKHYLDLFPDGDRFLFICDMSGIAACIDGLNALGTTLTALLGPDVNNDPVRDAISEALIAANADSSYVYVLRFLKLLAMTLKRRISPDQLAAVAQRCEELRQAIPKAFQGNMGDSTDVPVSPLIWVPFRINAFIANEASYNSLDSSKNGNGGWAVLWKTFHGRENVTIEIPYSAFEATLGLPTTKQLAL